MALNPKIARWDGQRVWVVGASTGIGAALARQLLAAGARVALSARRRAPLDELASVAAAAALVLPLDVTDHAQVTAAARQVQARWGGIDLVLLVAGTYTPMRADTWDLSRARALLDVNLHGVLNCVDATLPVLLAQGRGGIAIVASVAGYIGLPHALVYGPSKAALINLAESLYGDLHPRGIGVYLINPGFVDTRLTQRNGFAMPALLSTDEAARRTLAGIARGAFEIHYPRRFTCWLKLARILPYRWQFAAVRRATGA
jgi:NAD(P)-dependent dehydrogenase (short-subunit alcohol dehydrogenase family)